MDDPNIYEPDYVRVDAIPLEGPDQYSVEEKRRALFQAESTANIDFGLNGVLPENARISRAVQTAILNLGTFHLTRGAQAPDDVTLGDLSDGGDQQADYSTSFKETYNDILEAIDEGDLSPDSTETPYESPRSGVFNVNLRDQ